MCIVINIIELIIEHISEKNVLRNTHGIGNKSVLLRHIRRRTHLIILRMSLYNKVE